MVRPAVPSALFPPGIDFSKPADVDEVSIDRLELSVHGEYPPSSHVTPTDDQLHQNHMPAGEERGYQLGVPVSESRRESRLESADTAEGIFDLYDSSSIRDSWASGPQVSGGVGGEGVKASQPSSLRQSFVDAPEAGTVYQERTVGPSTPNLHNGGREEIMADNTAAMPSTPSAQRSHRQYKATPPHLILTPDRSPSSSTALMQEDWNGQSQSRIQSQSKSGLRESTGSTGSSTEASYSMLGSPNPHSHGTPNRLSPRTVNSVRNGAGVNSSQASFAGSSQYPGEEDDAFYVRSTYARLDVEGVHGDGWDPGVERTRGGPLQGKRATVFEASKGGDVGESERDFLASLDRYGFVNGPLRNRSETRLALIPSAPLLKIPKLPAKSPIPPGTKPPPPPSAFATQEGPTPRAPASPTDIPNVGEKTRQKEAERVEKWMNMMSVRRRDSGGNIVEWGWKKETSAKVTRRVYKGIPDRWRMAAWWTLAEDRTRDAKGKGRETKPANVLAQEYAHAIDLPSTHDVQIDLDVPRTISGHTLFVTRYGSGQRNLFKVLHAFSLVCDTCGYCQGMGPIAATLLCYYDPERVYALLVRLHDVYGMHSIFAPGFPGLLEAFYVQERLMEYLMPDVYKAFQRNMISSSAWGTKWYITLFVNTLPFSQQLRLWDALWLEGRDVMIVTSIAILWAFRDLLAAPEATFESILSLLSSYFVAQDEDSLMRFVRKILASPGVKARMDGWRDDWARLVKEGKSAEALL